MIWRNLSIALGITCCLLFWRDCTRRAPKPKPTPPSIAECERVIESSASPSATAASSTTKPALPDEPRGGITFYGFHIPAWAVRMGPQPGENLIAYRDRMMPLAKAAVAPHRTRVARGRDDFAVQAGLDSRQRAELDAAVQDAATQIQDRVLNAALGGDFSPQSFKPMTGVTLARDLLDTVDQANKRFLGTLREDQRAKLARHPFDVADYLVFSTKWEEALGIN
ncbi:MAG: hypothetical protein ABI867_18040 [Kofleriaceae bacterium]